MKKAHNQAARRNNKTGPHDQAGYTLLEVTVALLIVALSLGAVFQNLSQSKRAAIRSEKALKAVRLAHNIFHDTQAINSVMREEVIEQDVTGETDWQYRLSADPLVLDDLSLDGTKTEDSIEITGVKKLTLCLVYTRGEKPQSFCFTKWRKP